MIGTTQNSHGAYMIHDENTAHLNTVREHTGPMRKQNIKKSWVIYVPQIWPL